MKNKGHKYYDHMKNKLKLFAVSAIAFVSPMLGIKAAYALELDDAFTASTTQTHLALGADAFWNGWDANIQFLVDIGWVIIIISILLGLFFFVKSKVRGTAHF